MLKPDIMKLFIYYERKKDRVDDSISVCQVQIKMSKIGLSLNTRCLRRKKMVCHQLAGAK